MEVGNVNSKHLVLPLKVKSILDPCKDENRDAQGDDMSLEDYAGDDKHSSDSEVMLFHPQQPQRCTGVLHYLHLLVKPMLFLNPLLQKPLLSFSNFMNAFANIFLSSIANKFIKLLIGYIW